jgi:hypothetical protein
MTEAITRLFFALNVHRLNIILFLISIRLFKSHIIFEGVSWLHPGPLGERMVMWIFDSYFKGCVELWSRERDLERSCTK